VQRVEQARAAAFHEDGVVCGALVCGEPFARTIGQHGCGEGRHGQHDCESKEPLRHLPPPIRTLPNNLRVNPTRQSIETGATAWRTHAKGESAPYLAAAGSRLGRGGGWTGPLLSWSCGVRHPRLRG